MFQNLLFADDAAFVAHIESALQRLTSCFAEAAQLFGLEVSLKKTEVLYHPAPRKEYCLPNITIGETVLKTVYLPGVYNHIRRQDRQGSGQQTSKVKQNFRQAVQQSMEKQASEEGHQDQRVQSRRTHHPTV